MATSGTLNGAGSVTLDCPGCCTTATCNKCGNGPGPGGGCNPAGPAQYKCTFSGVTLCGCQATGVGYSSGIISGSINNSYTLNGTLTGDTVCGWGDGTDLLESNYNDDTCTDPATSPTTPAISLSFYKNNIAPFYTAILQVWDSASAIMIFYSAVCQSTPFDCCTSITFTNEISCNPIHTDGSQWNIGCAGTPTPGFQNSALLGSGGSALVVPI